MEKKMIKKKVRREMKRKIFIVANGILFAIYAAALVYVLFLNGRGLVWSGVSFKDYCRRFTNLIPLWDISAYFVKVSSGQLAFAIALRNILGNFLMFMPLAYFAYIFKRPSIRKYTIMLLVILVVIELLQLLLRVGSCDIDDIILGLSGSVLVYAVISTTGSAISEKKKAG